MERMEAFIMTNKEEFIKVYEELFHRYTKVLIDSKHSMEALLLAAYTDIQTITEELKKTNTFTCSTRCSNCCYGDIFLSPIEALLIKEVLKESETMIDKDLLAKQKKTPYHKRKYADKKCSLLDKEGNCSIYAGRPVICRIWNSISDPNRCNLSTGKQTAGTVNSLHYYAIAAILGQFSIVFNINDNKETVNLIDIIK